MKTQDASTPHTEVSKVLSGPATPRGAWLIVADPEGTVADFDC